MLTGSMVAHYLIFNPIDFLRCSDDSFEGTDVSTLHV